MSTYSIYFSPTQGTKKITTLLANEYDYYKEIDLCKSLTEAENPVFSEKDVCFFGVPSYGGRVPSIAAKRIKYFTGNHAKAILVVAYGNREYDDTLLELYDILKERGFHCIGAIAAIAEHSIMRQFATGRPDEQDITELKKFAKKIQTKITTPTNTELKIPGNRPYIEYHGVPLKPQTTEFCSKCGLCATLCPIGAISMEEPTITDKDTCISCMRCIQVCPNNARTLDEVKLSEKAKNMAHLFKERKKNELFL